MQKCELRIGCLMANGKWGEQTQSDFRYNNTMFTFTFVKSTITITHMNTKFVYCKNRRRPYAIKLRSSSRHPQYEYSTATAQQRNEEKWCEIDHLIINDNDNKLWKCGSDS